MARSVKKGPFIGTQLLAYIALVTMYPQKPMPESHSENLGQ